MLEQTPPMTQSPWDGSNNQQLFQFPPASSASTTDSYAPRYDTIEETDDTPDWLGGPLTEDLNMVEAPTQRLEQPYQQAQQRYQQPYHHPRQAYPSFDPSASAEFGDLTSPLPFRRHSLAHEPLLSQPQQQSLLMRLSEKRASLSGASPSSSILSAPWSNTSNQNRYNTSTKKEAFGSTIWSATNSPSATQTSFLWDQGTTSSPSYAPSPTSASSSLFPRAQLHSLSEQSVFPTHGVNEMMWSGGERRRLSLTPMPSMSDHQPMHDYFRPHADMLSSVPEEQPGLLPYRRHSLGGPLLNVNNSIEAQRRQQRQLDSLLPSNLLTSSGDDIVCTLPSMSWCMVEFKAGRAEIYYSAVPVEKDDWVIVEADRGRDLGKVVAKDLPTDQVNLLLRQQQQQIHSTAQQQQSQPQQGDDPSQQQQQQHQQQHQQPPKQPTPKRICRLATTAEITLLVTKRQDEQKALLICQTKSKQKKLMMDIVDAEYQWDRRKLTFFFVAERRVDFRELVRDLFKIYKTRIWMCSVNTVHKKPPML